jgi:hypothetical protein
MDIGLLDALRKLAYVLVVPLFIAAYFNDQGILNEYYQLDPEAVVRFTESSWFDWMLNSSDFRLWGIGWGLFIGFYVVVVGFFVLGSAFVILESDWWTRLPISFVFGIGCMLIAVLFIAGLAAGAPFAKLNPFWNGGLICFGFILLDNGKW